MLCFQSINRMLSACPRLQSLTMTGLPNLTSLDASHFSDLRVLVINNVVENPSSRLRTAGKSVTAPPTNIASLRINTECPKLRVINAYSLALLRSISFQNTADTQTSFLANLAEI